MFGQSSKKSKSSESSSNSSGSGTEFVSSPQTFRSPQPSRFGTSPPVLLLEDELHQKDAHAVDNLTLGLVALLKCAFNVDRQAMLGGFVR